jgi:glycosyltransferase involved in cell wall biosynthesis
VCIGSDVGGLTELITDRETGMIFKSGDAHHLADVIGELSRNHELMSRLGTNAQHFVRTERDWQTVAAGYLDIYRELTGGASAAALRHNRGA